MKKQLFIFFLFLSAGVFAQHNPNHLTLDGTVMGYSLDLTGLFKKEKIEIQGSLSNVSLIAKAGDSSVRARTDNGGSFQISLPLGSTYTLTYSKSGYGTSCIKIDVTNIPEDMASTGLVLRNIELLLNDNVSDKPIDKGVPFATVFYDRNVREFKTDVTTFDKKEQLFKNAGDNAPVNLIKSSVAKNRNNNREPIITNENTETTENTEVSRKHSNSNSPTVTEESTEVTNTGKRSIKVLSASKITNVNNWNSLSTEDINDRAREISDAWDQLEKDKLVAVTEEDFMLIQAREELLMAAEKELEAAKAYIDEQEGKLAAQQSFMWALIGLIVLLGGFVFVLIRSIREKKKSNIELDKRNKKITASINYAERIQRSVLLRDEEIKAILPESFVFYQPLDVVSGDFYWFSEINGKVIMAAVDCTGHGVPGAFMSLIGNTLLNQIVNEKKITQPAEILKHLHEGIVESLNQESDEEAAQDGMDLSVCTLNKATNELYFSGAMNPLYIVRDGNVEEVAANLRGIGGIFFRRKGKTVPFEEHKITLKKGSNIYMFSDGYMDQFGGERNEKFNIGRFKELLLNIENNSMDEQKAALAKAIKDWRGETQQIDDILVIGARL